MTRSAQPPFSCRSGDASARARAGAQPLDLPSSCLLLSGPALRAHCVSTRLRQAKQRAARALRYEGRVGANGGKVLRYRPQRGKGGQGKAHQGNTSEGGGGGGNRTPSDSPNGGLHTPDTSATEAARIHRKSQKRQCLTARPGPNGPTLPEHNRDTSDTPPCATCVQRVCDNLDLPGDLRRLMLLWPDLTEAARAAILTLAETVRRAARWSVVYTLRL